mgnify:CR=1 FL=1
MIPARGGSKRIPRKNIRLFRGKPIIAWSIAAARDSGCFDRIIVSTEDDEIADVAIENGAEVPFRRPQELADDYASTAAVIGHAVTVLAKHLGPSDAVCCLYPTAPLIKSDDLGRACAILEARECAYVFPVARYPSPIQRALHRNEEGRVCMFDPAMFERRSQDLEEAWHDAGQFYLARPQTWLAQQTIFCEASIGLELPAHRVVDIDTLEDWKRAEVTAEVLARSG